MVQVRLTSYPVIGFEYDSHNANEQRILDGCDECSATICMVAANVFKVLGAFNPLVGLARLADVILDLEQTDAGWKAFRAVGEMAGCGWIFLIADIANDIFSTVDAEVIPEGAQV